MRINPADKFSALPPVIPPPSLVPRRLAGFRFHRLLVSVWVLSLVGVPGRAAAETYTWTGKTLRDEDLTSGDNLWDNPGNWLPNGVPGADDIVVMGDWDTVDSTVPRVVKALRKTGAGYLGNFSVEVTGVPGSSVWSGGLITGHFTVAAGSSMTINTTLNPGMSRAVIHNFGTIMITGSPDSHLNGHESTINNSGLLQVARDGLVLRYNSATWGGVINNTGTIVKTTGAGTATFDWALDNNGVAGSDSGALVFATGSTAAGSTGIFRSGTSGARTEVSGGSILHAGARFTGPGRGRISGGTMTLDGAVEIGSPGSPAGGFEITGGTLDGAGSLAVVGGGGTVVWTAGTLNTSLTIGAGARLEIDTTAKPFLSQGGILNNAGTCEITGSAAGYLDGYKGTFNNSSLLQLVGDGMMFHLFSERPTLNNTGTIVKTTGPGTATVDWVLSNSGVAGSNSGSLVFAGGGTPAGSAGLFHSGTIDARTEISGGILLNAGARFTGPGRGRISGGTMTLTGAVEVGSPGSPAGGFEITGGTLDGAGSLAVVGGGGTVVWTAGTLNTTLTIGAGARLEIDTTASPMLYAGGILNNAGTAIITGPSASRMDGYNGTFNNSGLLQIARDGLVFHNYSGMTTLNNTGTVQLNAQASSVTLDWQYNQSATGKLNLKIGGTNPATPQFDQFNCTSSVSLGGALNVALINGFVPTQGGTFTVMTYGSRTGTFATFNSPGAYFSRAYGASDLTLTATNAPTNYAEWKAAYFAPGSPDAADNADTDHDGISTLLEFATGGNPLISEAPTTSVAPPAGGFIDFYYDRSIVAMAELQFQAEWNDMLLPGGWSDIGVTESILSNNGSVQRVKAHVPTEGRDSRFVHLSVTKP